MTKQRKLETIGDLAETRAASALRRGTVMTRALLCTVLLLSLSCSSGSTDGAGNNKGGSGNPSAGSGGAIVGASGSGNNGGTSSSAAGSAGTVSAGGAAATNASVTQWGNDIAHTAHYVHASLSKANMTKLAQDTFPAPVAPATESASNFSGEIAAIPLYLAGSTAGAGEYIAVTTQNNVYAFKEGTGVLAWKHNIGAPLGAGGSQCGSPSGHGIVSTPVIDATARVIYLVGGMTDGHYEVHALNADSGMELAGGWPVNVSNISAGSLKFSSVTSVQIQRSALSLVNGTVYIAFGGFCGDQGNYHGWVVGVNSKDPTMTGAWATMDNAQGGIWAPGGMASDGNGVFAVTGNVAAAQGSDHSTTDSEEIIRITGLGVGNRDAKNLFFPTEWSSPMNANDLDFGSSSPAIITVPNSTPSSVIVAPAKPGRVYFLDAANLGASLGQFADLAIADTTGQSVYTAPSAYTSASGVHVALVTGGGSQCPAPVGTNSGSVMSILLQPGATADKAPTPKIAWCAQVGTGDNSDPTYKRSPISTSSTGNADPIVWVMNGSKLNAFDGDSGAVVFNGGTGTCGGVHAFTQPIAANGHILTAGDGAGQAHLCSWSVHN